MVSKKSVSIYNPQSLKFFLLKVVFDHKLTENEGYCIILFLPPITKNDSGNILIQEVEVLSASDPPPESINRNLHTQFSFCLFLGVTNQSFLTLVDSINISKILMVAVIYKQWSLFIINLGTVNPYLQTTVFTPTPNESSGSRPSNKKSPGLFIFKIPPPLIWPPIVWP